MAAYGMNNPIVTYSDLVESARSIVKIITVKDLDTRSIELQKLSPDNSQLPTPMVDK